MQGATGSWLGVPFHSFCVNSFFFCELIPCPFEWLCPFFRSLSLYLPPIGLEHGSLHFRVVNTLSVSWQKNQQIDKIMKDLRKIQLDWFNGWAGSSMEFNCAPSCQTAFGICVIGEEAFSTTLDICLPTKAYSPSIFMREGISPTT